MTYADAAASNLSKPQVYELAEAFAKQFGYSAGGDIYDFVHRIGGEIAVSDTLLLDPERAGSLYVEAPDQFKIILPAHTGPSRDRFTIAHELGHYVLHYLWDTEKYGKRMMALRKGSDRIEWEANWFAAAFLMPGQEFKNVFHSYAGDISEISEHFGVSPSAAEVRAKGLGLI